MNSGKPRIEFVCEVDISIMNANMGDLPTGQAQCEFMDDGSLNAFLAQTDDVYSVSGDSKLDWQFGLMGLVNKEYIYLSIGLGVVAKVISLERNQEIESWLRLNHSEN